MVRTLLVLFFLVAGTTLSAAPVGTLAALEGEVTVLRSGVLIPSEKLAEGFPLEAFDTISTGTTGRTDVRLLASLGVTGSVRLDPSTVLYLDATALKREQTVGVELLNGSVTVRVAAVTGTSAVEIRTDAGNFSSPGPGFRVVESAGGDVLVTTASGRVACQLPARTVFVEPGTVLPILALEQTSQAIPMNVSTLDAFEASWLQQRAAALKDQSATAFRSRATAYQLQVGLFQRAWDRVQRDAREDAALKASTANLRRAAFPLERTLFRVKVLRGLLDTGTLSPSLELTRGYAAKDFFRQTAAEEATLTARLAESRGLYKALAERSGGVFPKAANSDSITGDTDYFH